jgi:hypothetical protein
VNFKQNRVTRRDEARRISMKTASEYRALADECFKWARETQDDEVSMPLLQLAQAWLDRRCNTNHPGNEI